MRKHNVAKQHIWKLGSLSLSIFTAQKKIFFSVITAETLMTISIAIVGFPCLAAQLESSSSPCNNKHLLFISWTANEWQGTAALTFLRMHMQRVNCIRTGVGKAQWLNHRICQMSIKLGFGLRSYNVRSGKYGQLHGIKIKPIPDWKNQPSSSSWDKTVKVLLRDLGSEREISGIFYTQ